jgi:hypothetical protein
MVDANLAVCPVEARRRRAQSREIAELYFLTGTIAAVRSRLRRMRVGSALRAGAELGRPASVLPRTIAAGACCLCGSTVEEGLARLGSTHCHDCRRGSAHLAAQERI